MSRSIDSLLVLCWVAILALGTVMVASASVAISDTLMLKHGVYLAAALAGLVFVLCVPMDWWRRGHRLAWLVAVVLCVLVLVPGIGLEANGARRWIGLGAFSLQATRTTRETSRRTATSYRPLTTAPETRQAET